MPTNGHRTTVVVITRDRRPQLCRTLPRLLATGCPVLLVDNGSVDGTAEAVAREFPQGDFPLLEVIRLPRNVRAGRNALGTAWLRRPAGAAVRSLVASCRAGLHAPTQRRGALAALSGLPWVLRERRVTAPHVQRALALVEQQLRTEGTTAGMDHAVRGRG